MQTLTYKYSYTSELVAIFILLHNTCTLSRYRQSYPCSLIFVYHMFQFLLLQFYKNFMLLFTHYFTIHREYLRRKFSVHFQIHSNAYACPNLIFFLILQNDCWRGYTLSAAPILYQYYIYCGYKSLWNNEFFMWIQSLLSFYWEDRVGSFLIAASLSILSTRHLMIGHGIGRGLPNAWCRSRNRPRIAEWDSRQNYMYFDIDPDERRKHHWHIN